MKVLELEIKAVERTVKNGKDKGKKFMAYQIFNKKTGYYEELRFNSKVKNMPIEEGTHLLLVDSTEINRIGKERRKFPLTWISKINEIKAIEKSTIDNEKVDDDLPF